jgi:carbamate kinase
LRLVIALGGNALLQRGEPATAEVQRRNARKAAQAIAAVAAQHEIIVTHGNGPQIGLLALQNGTGNSPTYPLDVLGAETDGMIGYVLEQELINALGECRVATLLTQIEVSSLDPAFQKPTKFIGPGYDDGVESRRMADARGWSMAQDGPRWRRVVASPEPRQILALRAIRELMSAGFVTICGGGGGIPVTRSDKGFYQGVECVVDKDLTSALLADQLDADCLLMLTDVPAVFTDFGTPEAREIRQASAGDLSPLHFPAGSMRPKIEAARRFASRSGRRACIGRLGDVQRILDGSAGTTISADFGEVAFAAPPCEPVH